MRDELPPTAAQRHPCLGRLAPTFDDPLMTAREGAAEVGASLAAFWRAVAGGRLPRPLYPLPRAPRWRQSELRAALEATRALPSDAKAARRAAHLARQRSDQ